MTLRQIFYCSWVVAHNISHSALIDPGILYDSENILMQMQWPYWISRNIEQSIAPDELLIDINNNKNHYAYEILCESSICSIYILCVYEQSKELQANYLRLFFYVLFPPQKSVSVYINTLLTQYPPMRFDRPTPTKAFTSYQTTTLY